MSVNMGLTDLRCDRSVLFFPLWHSLRRPTPVPDPLHQIVRTDTLAPAPPLGYRQPIVYNLKVAGSLARQVYLAEKLAPPTHLSSWTTAYAKIWSRATSASWYRQIMANGEWVKIGIYVGVAHNGGSMQRLTSSRDSYRASRHTVSSRSARSLVAATSSATSSRSRCELCAHTTAFGAGTQPGSFCHPVDEAWLMPKIMDGDRRLDERR